MLLVPGTFEHYSQLDIAHSLLDDTLNPEQAYIHISKGVASFDFSQVRVTRSRFQQFCTYPQDDHEAFLYQTLKERGGDVQWDTELLEVLKERESINVKLRHNDQDITEYYDSVHTKVYGPFV